MLDAASTSLQPRAVGAVRVSVGPSGLQGLRQSGAMKLLFPKRQATSAVMVNTAGGITGGDRFDVDARVQDGSALTLTTQACERAYAAQPGLAGRLSVRLHVDGTMHWLPQETLLFENCNFQRDLTVELASNARFLLSEAICFGRLARGESLRNARFRDRITIRRAGRLIYRDGVNLAGDVTATLDRPGVGNGARAMASVVLAAPGARVRLDHVRDLLPETAGASSLGEDVLVVRMLAADGFDLRKTLIPVLKYLAGQDLPAVWRL